MAHPHQPAAGGASPHDAHHHQHAPAPGPAPGPQVDPMEFAAHPHAFIMAGHEALFLVHMTSLWMQGHTYQVVLRAHVPHDVMQLFRQVASTPPTPAQRARYHAPTTCVLTNEREPFAIPELPLGRRTFLGTVYRGFPRQLPNGWPYAEETPLADRVPVEVARVVYYRHFEYNARCPETQTYLLFGEGREANLHHVQTREFDYDHVAELREAPHWLHPDRLRLGVQVCLPDLPGDIPLVDDPFEAPARLRVHYQGVPPDRELAVDRTRWFSTLVTNSPGATPPAAGTPAAGGAGPALGGHS